LQALIAIRMSRHDRRQVSRFREYALQLPEVIGFYHVTGPNDFLVHVAVRDAEHLQELALEAFTTQPEVAHIETSLIFEYAANRIVPDYAIT
jgi:DNA-binding Lrp family transcriptional regulator